MVPVRLKPLPLPPTPKVPASAIALPSVDAAVASSSPPLAVSVPVPRAAFEPTTSRPVLSVVPPV